MTLSYPRTTAVGRTTALLASASLALTLSAFAQGSPGPQPVPLPPPIVAPADTPYPGTITLMVDLTDITRRIVNVHETIPVRQDSAEAGKLTLLYPQWIPGNHSPTGPISKVAGLTVAAQGKHLDWVRDRVNVYAFHIDIPSGVQTIDVDFQYLAPVKSREGRISISSEIADLAWKYGCALSRRVLLPADPVCAECQAAGRLAFLVRFGGELTGRRSRSLQRHDTEYAGRFAALRRDQFQAGGSFHRQHEPGLSGCVCDKPSDLAITPQELELHRNMVREAAKLFASHHYDHYDFLFLISDTVGGQGLEHHQSSEDGTRANYFTDWDAGVAGRDLLAHEYTHSWDGKFAGPPICGHPTSMCRCRTIFCGCMRA